MREIINNSVWGDFEDLFRPFDKNARGMRTDLKENEKQFEFDIDIPGFKKEEIEIDLKDGYLTVCAKREVNQEEKDQNSYIKRERHFSACRNYFVGDKIAEEEIKAKYENGVLNIIVPKQQPKELPKHKIQID